jgi:hypothetical protein
MESTRRPSGVGNGIKLVLVWGFVGIPLGWGIVRTLVNAIKAFQQKLPATHPERSYSASSRRGSEAGTENNRTDGTSLPGSIGETFGRGQSPPAAT